MRRSSKIFLITAALLIAAVSSVSASGLSMLHAEGSRIVNMSGQPVVLRGINLGGWLVEEPWMEPFVVDPPAGSPYPANKDHVAIWTTARERFGEAGMEQVRTAFRNSWIDESDFDRIHAAGMNCVRLPFLASLVVEPNGIHWLDQAIDWAAARGIYVILDMHGAPGSQSDQAHTGHVGVPKFFTDASNIRKACAIWAMLARRYRDNPAVAGYDLINEPMAAPGSDTLYLVEDRLYRAIRSVDTNHIVIVEDGYTGMQWMPFPIPAGWQNVVYSSHYYDFPAKSAMEQAATVSSYIATVEKEAGRRQIPWYVGEFGFEPSGTPEVLGEALGTMKANEIAATMWTYKTTWAGAGQQNLWGLYSNTTPIDRLDMFTDSKADLIRKCAEYRTERLTPNAGALGAFQRAAAPDAPTLPAPHQTAQR